MAISFFQRLRLGLRGWNRRRAESAESRQRDFLAREVSWSSPVTEAAAKAESASQGGVDREGLQVAFLDDSGRMEHYLDSVSGEVIEFLVSERDTHSEIIAGSNRYWRVPSRSPETERQDRTAFVMLVASPDHKAQLEGILEKPEPAAEFRRILATDRVLERAWYNFKNDRATAAIDRWLNSVRSPKEL